MVVSFSRGRPMTCTPQSRIPARHDELGLAPPRARKHLAKPAIHRVERVCSSARVSRRYGGWRFKVSSAAVRSARLCVENCLRSWFAVAPPAPPC